MYWEITDAQRPSERATKLKYEFFERDRKLMARMVVEYGGCEFEVPLRADGIDLRYCSLPGEPSLTFDPGDAVTFDNFIEVTIEDAATGEDRQKVYNARVGFSACEVPSEEPSSEPSEEPSTVPSETSGVEGGNPTPTPGDLPDTSVGQSGPMPATALAMLMLAAVATLVYVRLAQRR